MWNSWYETKDWNDAWNCLSKDAIYNKGPITN